MSYLLQDYSIYYFSLYLTFKSQKIPLIHKNHITYYDAYIILMTRYIVVYTVHISLLIIALYMFKKFPFV